MKKCSEIKDRISQYIDNELDPGESKAFEEHVAACKDCRNELDEMMHIVGLFKAIPEVELPENFRAELHTKLLEVQGQTQKAGKPPFLNSGYFKLFSSVAAVFLLVFLIKGLYGFDFFQGTKTSNSADRIEMAAEAPAQAQTQQQTKTQAGVHARKDMSVADETTAGEVMSQPAAAKYRSSTGAGASDSMQGTVSATREPDRSTSGDRNVQLVAEAKLAPEKVTRNQTTLIITVDDPAAQLENIRNIVLENGGAEQQKAKTDITAQVSGDTQATDTQEATTQETAAQETDAELVMSVPNIQYETLLGALKTNYGETNLAPGEIITEDMGPAIEELLKRSDSLDSEIEKLEKDTDGQEQEELDRLNAEKLEIQDEIDTIRLGTDNIVVKIILKKA